MRDRPLVGSVGASAGVTQRFSRVSLGLRGGVDRTVFEDARLTDGTILDQSDRDRTQYEARLRAGYEVKPGWTPFIEGIADTRRYDRGLDDSGFRRSSDGLGARAGSTFEITPILTGEASAGLVTRDYEDVRLGELRGPIAEGALIWAPTPLTTVRLRGGSEIGETSVAEANGVLFSRATLEVQHDLRRNLSLIGAVTVSEADYSGVRLREEGLRRLDQARLPADALGRLAGELHPRAPEKHRSRLRLHGQRRSRRAPLPAVAPIPPLQGGRTRARQRPSRAGSWRGAPSSDAG